MTARPLPAVYWSDKAVWARRCLAQSESFLLAVTDAVTDPADPWAIELRDARRDAAKADVEAWKAYIKRADEAFADAAEHEMAEQDRKTAAREHYEEQARLADDFIPRGLATCEHKCCPPAVCEFVGDCDSHRAAS